MPPQIQVKPTLLDVRPDIIKRGKELFGPEGIDETNKDKLKDRFKGLPEWAQPGSERGPRLDSDWRDITSAWYSCLGSV